MSPVTKSPLFCVLLTTALFGAGCGGDDDNAPIPAETAAVSSVNSPNLTASNTTPDTTTADTTTADTTTADTTAESSDQADENESASETENDTTAENENEIPEATSIENTTDSETDNEASEESTDAPTIEASTESETSAESESETSSDNEAEEETADEDEAADEEATPENENTAANLSGENTSITNYDIGSVIPVAEDSPLTESEFIQIFRDEANWVIQQTTERKVDRKEDVEGETGDLVKTIRIVRSKPDEELGAVVETCTGDVYSPISGGMSGTPERYSIDAWAIANTSSQIPKLRHIPASCPQAEASLAYDGNKAEYKIECANGNSYTSEFTRTNKTFELGNISIDQIYNRTSLASNNLCVVESENEASDEINNEYSTNRYVRTSAFGTDANGGTSINITLYNRATNNVFLDRTWNANITYLNDSSTRRNVLSNPNARILENPSFERNEFGVLTGSFDGVFRDGITPRVSIDYNLRP